MGAGRAWLRGRAGGGRPPVSLRRAGRRGGAGPRARPVNGTLLRGLRELWAVGGQACVRRG
eukprot:1075479-Lingulodinium_polyedra.AAC.1